MGKAAELKNYLTRIIGKLRGASHEEVKPVQPSPELFQKIMDRIDREDTAGITHGERLQSKAPQGKGNVR